MSRPPRLASGSPCTASRTLWKTNSAAPSAALIKTLPLKPDARVPPKWHPRHYRPAVAGADETVGPPVLHHLDAADDRGRLLAANRLRRMLVHRDHLRRLFDLGPFSGARGGQRRVDPILDTDEDDVHAQLAMRLDAARHDLLGGESTAHRIKPDFHFGLTSEGSD